MRWLVGFVFLLLALGLVRLGGCVASESNPCGSCDDGNPCTDDLCRLRCLDFPRCDEKLFYCRYSSAYTDGRPCEIDGQTGVCESGECQLDGETPEALDEGV